LPAGSPQRAELAAAVAALTAEIHRARAMNDQAEADRAAEIRRRDQAAANVATVDAAIAAHDRPADTAAADPLVALLPEPLRTPAAAMIAIGVLLWRNQRLKSALNSVPRAIESAKKVSADFKAAFESPTVVTNMNALLTGTAKRAVDEVQGKRIGVPL
jgi:Sec-independent protein translocase protein TatA